MEAIELAARAGAGIGDGGSAPSHVQPGAAAATGVTADDLRALEARYQALVLATGQITWTARAGAGGDAGEDWAGDGRDWRLFTGQDAAAAAGSGWLDALHPDDRERAVAAWKAAVAAQSSYEIDYRVRRHDGEYRWLLVRGVPVREADGSAREWVGTATDITERRQATDERTRSGEALRQSEARLTAELADTQVLQAISTQLIQEGNLDALHGHILDAAIAVMHADMGSMQMLYPERNELRLLAWKGFDPAAAAFWEWVGVDEGSSCAAALRTGERVIVHDVETCDFMAGAEDLEYYHRSGIRAVQSTPLVARNGQIVGMISTHWRTPHTPAEHDLRLFDVLARQAADLIERKQLERQSQESLEALLAVAEARTLAEQAANARMQTFVGIAGHELRTPITSLKANVQLAERALRACLSADLPPGAESKLNRAHGMLERAERRIVQLDRLIDDLLDMTRISEGKLELRLAEDDLGDVVREAVETQRLAWPSREITLDIQEAPLTLLMDADRVGQVVTNYLSNALKYSAADAAVAVTVTVTVTVAVTDGAEGKGDRMRIAVGDHGPGLSAEAQARLWQPFQQVEGIRQQSGSGVGLGLGLHISKTIIERHGGSVGVESTVGVGSTFWFELPLP